MKKFLSILASFTLLQFSVLLNGQNNALTPIALPIGQANLSSVEMMNFFQVMMEDSELLLKEIASIIPDEIEEINLEFSIQYDVVLTTDLAPQYWNEYAINTEVMRDYFNTGNSHIKVFSELLDSSLRSIENPFFVKYNSKRFLSDKQMSVFHSSIPEMGSKDIKNLTFQDANLKTNNYVSSIGNWNFRVGPGNGFTY